MKNAALVFQTAVTSADGEGTAIPADLLSVCDRADAESCEAKGI